MKLYAETSTERASKGQGGNKFLLTTFKDLNGDTILNVSITPRDEITEDGMQEYLVKIDGAVNKKVCHWSRIKGNKKKSDLCNCGSSELPEWHKKTDCKNPY